MRYCLFVITGLLVVINSFAQKNTAKKIQYYCSPCGCNNDGKLLDTGGKCSACGMRLIEVGKFNYEIGSVSSNGIIVFTSNKEGKNNLYYKKIGSSEKEKKIGEGSGGQISPDGKRIMFSKNEGSIYVYDVVKGSTTETGSKIRLENLQTPSWFSNNSIIFSAGKFPNLVVYTTNLDDLKTDTLIGSEGLRYGCKLSPGGNKIAYRCGKGTPPDIQKGIAVYDLSTHEEKFISNIGEYATWSPDNKSLAFHWPDSSDFCIYTVMADGTSLKKIAGIKHNDCELPIWSADGKKIYFQTNRRNGNWEIWVMNNDGSDQRPLIWE